MSGWVWDRRALLDALTARGYDIDPPRAETDGKVMTARRQRGNRVQRIAIDAAGRFRGEITTSLAESARSFAVAGSELRVVTTDQSVVSITGDLKDPSALAAVVDALDGIAAARPGALPDVPPGSTSDDVLSRKPRQRRP